MDDILLIGNIYVNLLLEPLLALGIEVIPLPENKAVSSYLRGHADLMAFAADDRRIVLARELIGENIVNILTNSGFSVIPARRKLGGVYPADISLCAARVGRFLLHNLKYTDEAITETLGDSIVPVHINQGYARCSICVVDDKSIITADHGAARAAQAVGLDVLLIDEIQVELPGFDNGFIGGASFRLPDGSLAFTGRIVEPQVRAQIEEFLCKRSVRPVYLTHRPVFDIGGAIAL